MRWFTDLKIAYEADPISISLLLTLPILVPVLIYWYHKYILAHPEKYEKWIRIYRGDFIPVNVQTVSSGDSQSKSIRPASFCRECGAPVQNKTDKFCAKCGGEL